MVSVLSNCSIGLLTVDDEGSLVVRLARWWRSVTGVGAPGKREALVASLHRPTSSEPAR
jgi:hypothetical protein